MRNDEQHNLNTQDDFDGIEIVNLDPVSREREGPAPTRVTLRSRFTRRQRIMQVAVSASIVIVAFVLILNSIAPIHTFFAGLAGSKPTPTPGSALTIRYFYLDASPPWGTLSLDGHPLMFTTETAIELAPGHHHFVWRASPFQPIRCTLSVPVNASDTCKHIPVSNPTGDPSVDALEVTFYDTLNMLPPAQQTALTRTIQAALDMAQSTATVQPGEQFVHFVGSKTIDVATQPLRATLHFDLSFNNVSLQNSMCANSPYACSFLQTFQTQTISQNCAYICTEPGKYTSLEIPNYWYTVVLVHAYWDYSTMSNQLIAADQPDSQFDVNESAHFVFVTLLWSSSRWQAAINTLEMGDFNSVACLAASNAFDSLSQPLNLNSFGFAPVPAQGPAAGCAIVVVPTAANPSSSVPVNAPQAICLYRFGLMLAANPLAHQYWPHLPLADSFEQSLARQLTAHTTV